MLCLFLLLTQLSKALRLLWSGKWAVFTPASLVFAVRRFIPSFDNYQQQDAQEFQSSRLDTPSFAPTTMPYPQAAEIQT